MQYQIKHEDIEQRNKHQAGRDKNDRFVQSVSSKAWLLIRLNVMFIVFCIPVLTIPASLTAMTKVLMNIVRKDDCSPWSDFWGEFKGSFLKSLAAGLIMGALMAAVFFTGYAIHTSFNGFVSSLGVALIIVFESLLYFAACYAFPLISIVDISLAQCIRNSFLLTFIDLKHNLLLLLPLALIAACILLYPVSLPLFAFIIFALCQYIVCYTVAGIIQKRIIDPFYTENQ